MTTADAWAEVEQWLSRYTTAHPDDDRSALDILLSAEYQDEHLRERYEGEETLEEWLETLDRCFGAYDQPTTVPGEEVRG